MMKALTCIECAQPLSSIACVNLSCKLCGIAQFSAAKEVTGSNVEANDPETHDLKFIHSLEFPLKKFRFIGVSRLEPQPNNLMISFNRPVTDRELITIHELLKDFTEEQNL